MINLSLHLLDDVPNSTITSEVDEDGDLIIRMAEGRERLNLFLGWKLAESLRDQLSKLLDARDDMAILDAAVEREKALEGK